MVRSTISLLLFSSVTIQDLAPSLFQGTPGKEV